LTREISFLKTFLYSVYWRKQRVYTMFMVLPHDDWERVQI